MGERGGDGGGRGYFACTLQREALNGGKSIMSFLVSAKLELAISFSCKASCDLQGCYPTNRMDPMTVYKLCELEDCDLTRQGFMCKRHLVSIILVCHSLFDKNIFHFFSIWRLNPRKHRTMFNDVWL